MLLKASAELLLDNFKNLRLKKKVELFKLHKFIINHLKLDLKSLEKGF